MPLVLDRSADADAPAAPADPAPNPSGDDRPGGRPDRPDRLATWRRRAPLISVTAVSLALNSWALSLNGLGNQYYSAASRSMATTWGNFFFVSFDPGGFISIDKPPVALWITGLSARVFGVNSWSILLPGAIAGALAVAVLWITINRRFGPVAATVAGAILALSPINVAVNRLNIPEPFLILFLVSAAWAVLRSFDARRPLRWMVLAGVFVALAFNTKMLAAYIPLPAIGLALLVGTAGWWERIRRAAVFGAVALAGSVAWIVVVDLVSPSSRPYVGGSTDNTVWNLVFGYNGFGRVAGSGGGIGAGGAGGFGRAGAGGIGGAGGPGGAMSAAGGIFGGAAGPTRLLGDALAGQVAWLLPLAVVGLAVGAWAYRRDRQRGAAIVLWGGWLAIHAVVFSYAEGTFHSYYTSVMVPAIAALVGIGSVALLALVRRNRWWLAVAAGAVWIAAAWQLVIVHREPGFYAWTASVLIAVVGVGIAVAVVGVFRRRIRLVAGALVIVLAGLLVVPSAWALSETNNAVLNATLPQAGPRTGSAGSSFGSVSSNGDPALAAFLRANNTGQAWDLVVASAQVGSGLIADEDLSVMALGGFMGTDPTITVAGFADLVAQGDVRFVLVSGSNTSGTTGGGGAGSFGGGRARAGGGGPGVGGSTSSVLSVIAQVCPLVSATSLGSAEPVGYTGSLYDCAGQADALRAGR